MNDDRKSLIAKRLKRADESFVMAKLAIENEFYDSAASTLYYSCYHLIQAVFAKKNLVCKTHSGLKILFAKHFINENILEERWGMLLARLFTYRQQGEYSDFDVDKEKIVPLVKEVMEFRAAIIAMLED